MASLRTLVDYPGTYGGPTSRDDILRVLKEALALVENTAQSAQLTCSPFRIEVLKSSGPPDTP